MFVQMQRDRKVTIWLEVIKKAKKSNFQACKIKKMVYSMCVAKRERVTPLPKIGNEPTTKSKGTGQWKR